MLKVSSKKATFRLTKRSLKANRGRNAVAVCAIALTCLLFTSLLTVGIGAINAFQETTARQSGGDGHAVLKYINKDIYNDVKDHPLIKDISYNQMLSESVDNPQLLKRRVEFYYMDDTGLTLAFSQPTHGKKPVLENELIADSKTLELLGVPLEIGAPVQLQLTVHERPVVRNFVLSGWWESDGVAPAGIAVASKAYTEAHAQELQNKVGGANGMTGLVNSYIMFRSSSNADEKLGQILYENGYSMNEEDENYIATGINWSYLSNSSGGDTTTTIIITAIVLLIVLTGYLIIYNIFQISVIKDIRFYGLLKTIGTTGRQIKSIIWSQALMLCIVGIPVGLLLGYFVGHAIFPLVLTSLTWSSQASKVSPHPLIFVGAALFSLFTVIISTAKPGRMAARVSPVEATRYTEGARQTNKKEKKGTGGGKLYRMALANLGRGKKRTAVTVLSLSLSLVVLTCVFSITQSFDMDTYVSKFVDSDFLVAHAKYMQFKYRGEEEAVSREMVEAIKVQPGFEEGGYFYCKIFGISIDDPDNVEENEMQPEGYLPLAQVYGIDDFPLYRRTLVEGELDAEKLASGDYIIEAVQIDDRGEQVEDVYGHNVGDTVRLALETTVDEKPVYEYRDFIVLAKIKLDYYTASVRTSYGNFEFYLPSDVYKDFVGEAYPMTYVFNVQESYEQEMERFLQEYTNNTEPNMHYESKFTYTEEFTSMKSLFVTVGGVLGGVIGFVGVLNFINCIATGIISRKREFAMMQSVGMTSGQLNTLLCFEGLYYVVFTIASSFALSLLFLRFAVEPFTRSLWFTVPNYTIMPLLVCWPILLVLGIAIPAIAVKGNLKESVVERLKVAE